jgi:hypothetical protein
MTFLLSAFFRFYWWKHHESVNSASAIDGAGREAKAESRDNHAIQRRE